MPNLYITSFYIEMSFPFMSLHLFFLLNCTNESFHKACYFLQVYSDAIALVDA